MRTRIPWLYGLTLLLVLSTVLPATGPRSAAFAVALPPDQTAATTTLTYELAAPYESTSAHIGRYP